MPKTGVVMLAWPTRGYQIKGLRPLIRMHLARRGGRKSEKKILPADVGEYIQGLRLSPAEQDSRHIPKPVQEGNPRQSPTPKRQLEGQSERG